MSCAKNFLLIVSVLTAVILFRYYKPLPEDLDEKGKVHLIVGVNKFIGDLARLGSILGYGQQHELYGYLIDVTKTNHYSNLKVTNTEFDGVRVRIYTPNTAVKSGPGVVFYHGGGWYFGSIDSHEDFTKRLALDTNAVVVSVKLAPKYPYPIPLEDCLKATVFFMKNAEKFGVDQKRIAVSGDSAGGNLAAAVSLKMREMRDFPQPKIQVLIYPLLQVFDLKLPSHIQFSGKVFGDSHGVAKCAAFYSSLGLDYVNDIASNNHTSPKLKQQFRNLLNPNDIPAEFREGYFQENPNYGSQTLSDKMEAFVTNPFVAPLMASNLKGLPEAYILTVDYDVIRDDGILYAKRLEKSGVKVTWKHIPNAFHGIINFVDGLVLESGIKATSDICTFLKQSL